jgi:HEPN domain-containing protein
MSASLPQRWLQKAAEDLAVARLVFEEDCLAHSCFLAQQCIEKALKAQLLAYTNAYPRTHKLVDLLGACENVELAIAQFRTDCMIVDQYYIPTRYPDSIPGSLPHGLLAQHEVVGATESAEKILQFTTQKLD